MPYSALAQRFAAVGDFGYAGRPERDVANLINSWNPEFVITLGDNNYDLGDGKTIDANIGQYYQAYIGNYQGKYGPGASTNQFFPSLGNHDLYTGNGQPYFSYFTLPGNERYYDFVRGNVHFFVLNSDPLEPDGVLSTSVQAQWLQQRLAQSPEIWKIVYFHHAAYSSGPHGSTVALQWPFRAWGASAVINGHDHHYERIMTDGIPFFVNGLGGRSVYQTYTPVPNSQIRYSGDFGAMLVQASTDSLNFQFITRNNKLIDTYTLHRAPVTSSAPGQVLQLTVQPNPLTEVGRIEFTQPNYALTMVRVLDVHGREIIRLHEGWLAPGRQSVRWERGTLAAGVYQVQVVSGATTQTVRLLAL
ncbi:alkaline phosphatase [Hymenobacter fodinae]|uniref:Alkaline phosphatase n=1 Tax=Hymenobacter fodinae TaxID=2510796 RepID=A0A4Z0PDD0_9BACT|nr:alkaline phosphatase [Hymenobacter fodinae]